MEEAKIVLRIICKINDRERQEQIKKMSDEKPERIEEMV